MNHNFLSHGLGKIAHRLLDGRILPQSSEYNYRECTVFFKRIAVFPKGSTMKINLSLRLSAVADLVLPHGVVADVGTDHGYLPAYLLMKGICPFAIAGDIAEQPLEGARQLVKLLNLNGKIDLRLGNGLEILQPGEAATICLAGMGAATMISILGSSPEIVRATRRLVMQPMRNAPRLRQWLADNGWTIVAEDLVWEEAIYYEIIAAEPGTSQLADWQVEAGPQLVANRHPLLGGYLSERIRFAESMIADLEKSGSPRTEDKKTELRQQVDLLQKVITWQQP